MCLVVPEGERASEVDESEQEKQEKRQHERELDHRCPPLALETSPPVLP
jgi:hypothetical protein